MICNLLESVVTAILPQQSVSVRTCVIGSSSLVTRVFDLLLLFRKLKVKINSFIGRDFNKIFQRGQTPVLSGQILSFCIDLNASKNI